MKRNLGSISGRVEALVLGALAFIAGIIGFFVSSPKVAEGKTLVGQLSAVLDKDAAADLQMWQNVYYASIVFMIIGALFIVVGVVMRSRVR